LSVSTIKFSPSGDISGTKKVEKYYENILKVKEAEFEKILEDLDKVLYEKEVEIDNLKADNEKIQDELSKRIAENKDFNIEKELFVKRIYETTLEMDDINKTSDSLKELNKSLTFDLENTKKELELLKATTIREKKKMEMKIINTTEKLNKELLKSNSEKKIEPNINIEVGIVNSFKRKDSTQSLNKIEIVNNEHKETNLSELKELNNSTTNSFIKTKEDNSDLNTSFKRKKVTQNHENNNIDLGRNNNGNNRVAQKYLQDLKDQIEKIEKENKENKSINNKYISEYCYAKEYSNFQLLGSRNKNEYNKNIMVKTNDILVIGEPKKVQAYFIENDKLNLEIIQHKKKPCFSNSFSNAIAMVVLPEPEKPVIQITFAF